MNLLSTISVQATSSSDFGSSAHQVILSVFGSQDELKSASPVTYITKDDPPFLIFQGELDTTVPTHQSQELYDRLTATGVPASLVMVKNAGHSFTPVGGPISPTRPEITRMMADFFDKQLRSNEPTGTRPTAAIGAVSPTFAWIVAAAAIAMGIGGVVVIGVLVRRKKQASSMTPSGT